MERATMKQTGAEWMYEKIQKEVVEKQKKELREEIEKETKNRELATTREDPLGILSDRFGPLPAALIASVEACEDRDRLRAATRRAATVVSLDAFRF